jgi:hypothetical protein
MQALYVCILNHLLPPLLDDARRTKNRPPACCAIRSSGGRFPTTGRDPRPGTLSSCVDSLSINMPPITVVPPSLTRTLVVDSLVRVEGMPLTCLPKSGVLFSTLRSRTMFPS